MCRGRCERGGRARPVTAGLRVPEPCRQRPRPGAPAVAPLPAGAPPAVSAPHSQRDTELIR
ncbi:hypothetical protein JYU34_007760 [Plutella xylostella]|uniref:Uncharacterized protein n=1 Tax=Plutella xylostella TaxID=51655 RepID=A0ABQ7QRD4_PLUXY|nr:hypothetical protein JYU34_007760 [Plutella xylostella]